MNLECYEKLFFIRISLSSQSPVKSRFYHVKDEGLAYVIAQRYLGQWLKYTTYIYK